MEKETITKIGDTKYKIVATETVETEVDIAVLQAEIADLEAQKADATSKHEAEIADLKARHAVLVAGIDEQIATKQEKIDKCLPVK
jgi:uncharacterized protein GlcG (DUF336 family)